MAEQLAQLLRGLLAREEPVTVGEVRAVLGERGFGVLLVLLAFPAALPLPAAGYSIPFGVGIFALGVGLVLGRENPALPRRLLEARLPRLTPGSWGFRFLLWLERLFRERPPHPGGPLRIQAGAVACVMGALMMIPIPGTNTLPGVVTFIIGLGVLYRDGLWTLIGTAAGLLLLGLYGAVVGGALRLLGLLGR